MTSADPIMLHAHGGSRGTVAGGCRAPPGTPSLARRARRPRQSCPPELTRSRPMSAPEPRVWLNEYETLDDARSGIGDYVDPYHHRPHSGLDYQTSDEVRRTWEDGQRRRLQRSAA